MLHIKKILLLLLVFVALVVHDAYYLERITDLRLFNIFIEFSFALMLAALFLSTGNLKGKKFYPYLTSGFFLVYISMCVDGLDQFFLHGEVYTAVLEKTPMLLGFVLIFIGVKNWIAEDARLHKKLENQAFTDDLTGLYNRRGMLRKFEELDETAKRNDLPLALVIADLDDFKEYNDSYGHISGDRFLAEMGQSLLKMMGPNEIIGRWGGEEFAICLLGSDINQAREFAEKIRHQVNDLVLPSSQRNHGITISLGVAEKQPDEPLMEAIKRADRSLYVAKRQGKNQTFVQ